MHLTTLLLAAAVAAAPPAPTVNIEHTPPQALSQVGGAIEAKISSPTGRKIFEPALFVRAAGAGAAAFQRVPMQPREGQLFAARVPAEIAGNDFEYFLEAFDEDGNGPFRKGSPEAPLRISSLPPAPPPLDLRGTTPQQTGRPLRATGIGLLTVGGAALLAGAVSGGLAVVAHNSEADAAARYDQPAYDSARSRYHSSLLAMDVLLPLGGTLAVTGAVLMVVSSMKEKPGPVSFNLSSDGRGATAMISGAF